MTTIDSLRDAIKLLNSEADQLEIWADQSIKFGWSTFQVESMRERARFLRERAKALRFGDYL